MVDTAELGQYIKQFVKEQAVKRQAVDFKPHCMVDELAIDELEDILTAFQDQINEYQKDCWIEL